jgi:hypothetical protein
MTLSPQTEAPPIPPEPLLLLLLLELDVSPPAPEALDEDCDEKFPSPSAQPALVIEMRHVNTMPVLPRILFIRIDFNPSPYLLWLSRNTSGFRCREERYTDDSSPEKARC